MIINAYAGPPKRTPQSQYQSSAHISITLRKPVQKQPIAGLAVTVRFGVSTWEVETEGDGIVTLAFTEMTSKDKVYSPLSIEPRGHAVLKVPYGLYPNALIARDIFLPAGYFAGPSSLLSACYVKLGGSRFVELRTPLLGKFALRVVRGNKGMIGNHDLPCEVTVEWMKEAPKLFVRGTALFDSVEIDAEHKESGSSTRIEAYVVGDAIEEPHARRAKLIRASANVREAVARELRKLVTDVRRLRFDPIENPEAGWAVEDGIDLDAFVDATEDVRIFLIGERHANPEDLEAVWAILAALHAKNERGATLLLEQIPAYDLRYGVGPSQGHPDGGVVDFATGLAALNARQITPDQFQRWTEWSAYWTNPQEDDKLRILVGRAVAAGMTVAGLDLQKDGGMETGDKQRDPFMSSVLEAALASGRTLVTLNGGAHLLGKDSVHLIGISRILRGKGTPVVTLRPVRGDAPTDFIQRQGSDDYRFTVPNYGD
jgi:hypothetical protein